MAYLKMKSSGTYSIVKVERYRRLHEADIVLQ